MFKIRFCLILFLFLCIRAVVFSEEYSAVMENYQGYSLEALKEFTGRFLFNECEIINISNMENPINIIMNMDL
jgi:hypothetical protein